MNAARAKAYLGIYAPDLTVKVETGKLREDLGHGPYDGVLSDPAPWHDDHISYSDHFWGLMPLTVEGSEDSTRTMDVTELSGDGAIVSKPRYGSREIRVTALACAKDEAGLRYGLSWLRDVLAADCEADDCEGVEAIMFASVPTDGNPETGRRYFYGVEVLEAPKVTKAWPFTKMEAVTVEFTLIATVPWSFTDTVRVVDGMLLGEAGFYDAYTQPADENCSEQNKAYREFINDPYFTGISQPPRPPVVKPPNLIDVPVWQRHIWTIPSQYSDRWGRVVPTLYVDTGTNDLQMMRVRFYKVGSGNDGGGCGYEGEFVISYIPKNSVLTIDGIHREAHVKLPSGNIVPGGHLLFGSDGRPFTWPTLGCHDAYWVACDLMPGNSGVKTSLDINIRE
jgi:hypothetical protein